MQMMFFCLVLLTFQVQFTTSNALMHDMDDSIFYDSTYYLKLIQKKKFQEELNKASLLHKKNFESISNLDQYISKNKENLAKFKEIEKIDKIKEGSCMKITDLQWLFGSDNDDSNISFLMNKLNEKNYIFPDEYGNLLIFSSCADFFNPKCHSKFFFLSKLDFNSYEFSQSGEKLPKLSGFALDSMVDHNTNNKIIYLYGGIDSKGEHNKDLFKIEFDYLFGNVKITKLNNMNENVHGFAELSINILPYSKEDRFNEKVGRHLIFSYGGVNDLSLNNKLNAYNPATHSWTEALTLKPRKGHSSLLVSNEDLKLSFDDNNFNTELMKTYYLIIFGGKSEGGYHNDIMVVQISYMALDDTFFYKLLPGFEVTGDVPLPREGHKVLLRKNYMYVFGGCNYQTTKKCFTDEIYRVDLSSLPFKWEKIENMGLNKKQHFHNEKLNFAPLMGEIVNFGFCTGGVCNNTPKLLIYDTECKCDHPKFIREKRGFVFTCNNQNLEDKKSVKVLDLGSKNNQTNHTLNLDNTTKITNINLEHDNENINTKLLNEQIEELIENNKPFKKTEIKKFIPFNHKEEVHVQKIENKLNSTEIKETIHITQNSTTNSTAHDNKHHNSTHHKKSKLHPQKLEIRSRLSQRKNPKHSTKEEMKKILEEAIKEIKHNMKPLLKESEVLKKALGIEKIENKTQNEFSFIQLRNRREILKENIDVMKSLSMNVTEIKSYIKSMNNKSNTEIKSYLEHLAKDLEMVNGNTQKRINEFEEFKNNQVKINKKIKKTASIKCENGYVYGEDECKCYPGYTGKSCEVKLDCKDGCKGKGICSYGKCFCNPGYSGDSCEVEEKCLNECYNRGSCMYGKCFCDAGFAGVDCGIKLECENNCSNRGICFREKCLCEPGYTGKDCSLLAFDFKPCGGNGCNGNGLCKMEKCFCYPGFSGPFCEIKNEFTCPPIITNTTSLSENNKLTYTPCNGNGICKFGMCFCYPGYQGEDCGASASIEEQLNIEVDQNKRISSKLKEFGKMSFREIEIDSPNTTTAKPSLSLDQNQRYLYIGVVVFSIIFVLTLSILLNKKFLSSS